MVRMAAILMGCYGYPHTRYSTELRMLVLTSHAQSPRSGLIRRIFIGLYPFLPLGHDDKRKGIQPWVDVLGSVVTGRKHACVCAGRTCVLCMMLVSLGYTAMTIQTGPGVFIKAEAPGSGPFVAF